MKIINYSKEKKEIEKKELQSFMSNCACNCWKTIPTVVELIEKAKEKF